MILRRKKTREALLTAGGVWDRLSSRFVPGEPSSARFIDLEESQVDFTRWYARWLAAFRDRGPRNTSLAIAGGERRGGKTFDLLMCVLATCIEVPQIDGSGLITWVVSCNYQERDEIDRTIREFLPEDWYTYRQAPEFRYLFINGATLRNVSADDPETLKRGRVDIVFYNEAQKLHVAAMSNGIMGTADKGGLAILAANPPRRQRGEWVRELKEAIEEQRVTGARFFGFSSKDNTQIDQSARSRVGQILSVIDPRAALTDDTGLWLPVGDRAYPKYDRKTMRRPPPDIGDDITGEWMRLKKGTRAYPFIGGVDFQGTPWHAGVVIKVFRNPADANAPIFAFVDELITEESTEDDFLDDVDDKNYDPNNLMWIGDASGQWQDGKHQTSLTGRRSFDIFKARRWNIQAPRKKRTEKAEYSKNPAVADRLSLMFKLMSEGRIIVDPDHCPRLDEAFKECPLSNINGRRLPSGKHAHITDAAGYVLYWLEPRPIPATGGRPGMGIITRDVRPSGIRYL